MLRHLGKRLLPGSCVGFGLVVSLYAHTSCISKHLVNRNEGQSAGGREGWRGCDWRR